jgi:hypothetical protein
VRWLLAIVIAGCAVTTLPPTVPLGPGHAMLHRDGDILDVTMSVGNRGIGSVLIQAGDRLWVLHASAALGTGIYRRDGASWRRAQDFDFQCREAGDTECRAAFRKREGWIANVATGGADRTFEIDLARFAPSPRIAVTYLIVEPTSVLAWPRADDDSGSLELQQGQLPDTLRMQLDRWAEVSISTRR